MKTRCYKNTRSKVERGFTVIEALIAFVVLAAGILTILSFHGTTIRSNADAKAMAEAVALAEEKVEELRGYLTHDPDGLVDPSLVLGEYADPEDSLDVAGLSTVFNREWLITECDGGGISAHCRHAAVTVSWLDVRGDSRQVTLRSDISYAEPARAGLVIAALAGGDGNGAGWNGTGDYDPYGNPEPFKELKKEDYDDENPLPEWWPEDVDKVSFYQIRIYGPIVIEQGNINVGGEVDAEDPPPEFQEILGDTDNVTAACNFMPPPQNESVGSYECTAIYSSLMDGWSGKVTYKAQRNGGAPVYCLPVGAYKDSEEPPHVVKTVNKTTRVYERTFSNVLQDYYLLISVAGGLNNCPNKAQLDLLD